MTPPPAPATTIGQRLKFEMKKRGISSAELARRAEVKISFLYDVISGKSAHPSTLTLARVATALNVSLSDLAGCEPDATQGDYIAIPRVMLDDGNIATVAAENEPCTFRKSWIREHLGAEPSALRLLIVRGDSMEPTLCHNDAILIDTAKKLPSPPGIFVLSDGFGLAVKRLEYTADKPQKLRFLSDNPHYSPYERSMAEVRIIGRVVWFARGI